MNNSACARHMEIMLRRDSERMRKAHRYHVKVLRDTHDGETYHAES
jgi:hypothetical protein